MRRRRQMMRLARPVVHPAGDGTAPPSTTDETGTSRTIEKYSLRGLVSSPSPSYARERRLGPSYSLLPSAD